MIYSIVSAVIILFIFYHIIYPIAAHYFQEHLLIQIKQMQEQADKLEKDYHALLMKFAPLTKENDALIETTIYQAKENNYLRLRISAMMNDLNKLNLSKSYIGPATFRLDNSEEEDKK